MRGSGYLIYAPFSSPYWQAKRSPCCFRVLRNFLNYSQERLLLDMFEDGLNPNLVTRRHRKKIKATAARDVNFLMIRAPF
jgi:hypothetical protein